MGKGCVFVSSDHFSSFPSEDHHIVLSTAMGGVVLLLGVMCKIIYKYNGVWHAIMVLEIFLHLTCM